MIFGFEQAFELLYKDDKKYAGFAAHPLYKRLHKLHLQNVKEVNYEREHPGGFNIAGETARNNDEMIKVAPAPELAEELKGSDEIDLIMKRRRTCDEIFAEYLNFVARKVNKDCYAKVLTFIFLFRECVNSHGDRLNEEQKNLPADLFPHVDADGASSEFGDIKEYCLSNNAEQVPDVSNEFIMNFLEEKKLDSIDASETIDLTQNLCHWLFINGYTCSKLSLIQ